MKNVQKEKGNKRKMKKQVRKTIGALFLISALIVAAIPLDGVTAATGVLKESLTWDTEINTASTIPLVETTETQIYTTGDGMFQFAYVKAKSTDTNKIAVILGYSGTNLANNTLEIPSTMDAYMKYTENLGTAGGYVAVGKDGDPLFYEVVTITMIDDPNHQSTGEANEVIPQVEDYTYNYYPCYYSDKSKWEDIDLDSMFYLDATNNYVQTTTSEKQWIKNVSVAYIGNQVLVSNTDPNSNQEWVVSEATANTDKTLGIFANESNIKTLIVGDDLLGIGNYAFYNCSSLNSITLGNGLTEIGKSAFENCINMSNVSMDIASKISYISDRTFYNCKALTNFTVPISVERIFDSAFEKSGLVTIELCGNGSNVLLSELGYYVFKDCTSLTSLTLPNMLEDDQIHINVVSGCSALKYISVPNKSTSFIEDSTSVLTDEFSYMYADLLACVSEEFYFEGLNNSNIQSLASDNTFAFKYLDEDIYEKIIKDGTATLTYRVNSSNELIAFSLVGDVDVVEIPAKIGPYSIDAISEGSFSYNCTLEKIIIPGTVTKINDNAFIGCHNLEDVIFEDADTITYIGTNSFATQLVTVDSSFCCSKCSGALDTNPRLTFTGNISESTLPFTYAMDASSNINYGTQVKSYITYYSGWPTNLEVSYNETTQMSELISIPQYADLDNYSINSYPYMTSELVTAAHDAFVNYGNWLLDSTVQLTENEWDIINSALKVVIPTGIDSFSDGLFSGIVLEDDGTITSIGSANDKIQSITSDGILTFPSYCISGCNALEEIMINGGATTIEDYAFAVDENDPTDVASLTTFTMTSGGVSIGDYAFDNQSKLVDVTLTSTVEDLGLRPFSGCSSLTYVDFSGSPFYTCDKAIIYGLSSGVKDRIVEVLETRGNPYESSTISADELSGITKIEEEAFMDVSGIGSVDLSKTTITDVPQSAFANTSSLYSVTLPYGCLSISENAFKDSGLGYIDIPNTVVYIDPSAFNTNTNSTSFENLTFYCEEGSVAAIYASKADNINVTDKPAEIYYTVYFWDYDQTILKTETVAMGSDATAPELAEREGYKFTGWSLDFTAVSRNLDVVAQYEKIDSEDTKFTVNFYDKNDTLILTQKVASGEDAISPALDAVDGYTFIGWRPAITNITKDIDTYAQYELSSGSDSDSNSDSDSDSDSNSDSDGSTSTGTLYTLTVNNGSGSGSYIEGATVIISANEAATTQEFNVWTVNSGTVTLASTTAEATSFTMPGENVSVTATYETKSTTSGGDSDNNSSGDSSDGSTDGDSDSDSDGSGDNTVTSGNNTVIIDKNGLSNTDKVSITVNGSSDNFTVVIQEDADATEEILRALIAEYGSLDNIKYFPMDITLYDATGKIKITDTTGLSIDITLPIPDSLIPYAGNNQTAAVNNEKLEALTPRFSTIDGVACITFRAEHFSPYVIYVDTTNLSADSLVDEVPKTGDGLHPKWFVSIGLACMSFVFFTKKDKIQPKLEVKKV